MRWLVMVLLAAVMGCGGDEGDKEERLTPAEARFALADLGIDYTAMSFNNAAASGDLVVVKLFVDAGMSVDTEGVLGFTTLHEAAYGGHLSVVRFLVEQGADMNAKVDSSNTFLQVLVGIGARVGATYDYCWTAKDFAQEGGHTAVVEYLESQGG